MNQEYNWVDIDGRPCIFTFMVWRNSPCCEAGHPKQILYLEYERWRTGDPVHRHSIYRSWCESCGSRVRAEMLLLEDMRLDIRDRWNAITDQHVEISKYQPPRRNSARFTDVPEAPLPDVPRQLQFQFAQEQNYEQPDGLPE